MQTMSNEEQTLHSLIQHENKRIPYWKYLLNKFGEQFQSSLVYKIIAVLIHWKSWEKLITIKLFVVWPMLFSLIFADV